MAERRLFHYTTASRFQGICAEEQIRPATAFVPENEKPTTWFSFRETFEPTALPGIRGTRDPRNGLPMTASFEYLVEHDTPFRIEIAPEDAPMDWPAWREHSGVYPDTARSLKRAAEKQKANVNDWRMAFGPVPWSQFLAIECYVDGAWRDLAQMVHETQSEATHAP